MAEGGRPTSATGDKKVVPITQTFNVVPQKVIQVNKPAGYYENREKIKIFIYQIQLYWIINVSEFSDARIKMVFAASYY